MVAYCFAPVEGYSAFGSYTGNGDADGPFVYTGMRPKWIMTKVVSGDTGHWWIYDSERDPYNLSDSILNANLTNANLTAADLSNVNLSTVKLTLVRSGRISRTPTLPVSLKLVKGYLVGPRADLTDADLSNANLNDGGNWNTTLQVDYEKPLDHDGKLELGYKTILRESNEDQRFWQRDSVGVPFTQAYDFRYREDIHAAYATWGRKYGAWGIQVGGRGEVVYTTAELEGDSADIAAAVEQLGGDEAVFVNDYVSFYPSANLSYTIDDRNQWVLSYNRRVNRPRGRQVNPFVDNADPRNLRYGNPFLRPEYTDGL